MKAQITILVRRLYALNGQFIGHAEVGLEVGFGKRVLAMEEFKGKVGEPGRKSNYQRVVIVDIPQDLKSKDALFVRPIPMENNVVFDYVFMMVPVNT